MLRLKYGVGDDACGCACCHAYRTKCHVDGEATDSIMHCHIYCAANLPADWLLQMKANIYEGRILFRCQEEYGHTMSWRTRVIPIDGDAVASAVHCAKYLSRVC